MRGSKGMMSIVMRTMKDGGMDGFLDVGFLD